MKQLYAHEILVKIRHVYLSQVGMSDFQHKK